VPSFRHLNEESELNRQNWYSLSKIHGEELLSMFSDQIEINIIRPFGVYGPGQKNMLVPNIAQSILEERTVKLDMGVVASDSDNLGLRISLCPVESAIKILFQVGVTFRAPQVLNL